MDMTLTLDDVSPKARLAVLLTEFSRLGDDREQWRVMYPLSEVLLLLTCATITSCDDFDDIAAWGQHHIGFLRRFAAFHHGIPCERWLRTLVNRVDPVLFGRCFDSWIAALWPDRHDVIAIKPAPAKAGGKTARRTHDKRTGLKALHTLSAYATNARLSLAQLSVPEKTNEITAIPDLLDQLAGNGQLAGALVTIDAMGTQVEIADRIIVHKADFLLPLKGNQPTLETDVTEYFRDHRQTPNSSQKQRSRKVMAASRPAPSPHPTTSTGSDPTEAIPANQGSRASRPSPKSSTAPNIPIGAVSTRAFISVRPPSTSNALPQDAGDIGAWRAFTGCSMSNSRTTCPGTEQATAPRTWPSSAASLSTYYAPTPEKEASRRVEKPPAGTQNSCSKSSS